MNIISIYTVDYVWFDALLQNVCKVANDSINSQKFACRYNCILYFILCRKVSCRYMINNRMIKPYIHLNIVFQSSDPLVLFFIVVFLFFMLKFSPLVLFHPKSLISSMASNFNIISHWNHIWFLQFFVYVSFRSLTIASSSYSCQYLSTTIAQKKTEYIQHFVTKWLQSSDNGLQNSFRALRRFSECY